MPRDYLHNRPDFADLIRTVAIAEKIAPALVEKDYWITHGLYGLQQLGLTFELKGGTLLSKGYGIIERFSEDIRIEPPKGQNVATGHNQNKPAHAGSRKAFYDWLAQTIRIDGVTEVVHDAAFDDERYRSGGIRLHYKPIGETVPGLKSGVLLEIGFDDVVPNTPRDISSWAYDYAVGQMEIINNRAPAIRNWCCARSRDAAVSIAALRQDGARLWPICCRNGHAQACPCGVRCIAQRPAFREKGGKPSHSGVRHMLRPCRPMALEHRDEMP